MLAWTGLDYILRPVDTDERHTIDEAPDDYVMRMAQTKGKIALKNSHPQERILAADTTVADGDLILGKPADAEEARQMLRQLRGRTHQVFTALAVYTPASGGRSAGWLFDLCQSQVPMRHYSDDEIEAYIDSGDPMDKAGAYAIQNRSFQPVTDFSGCFANVMGLPLCHLVRTLRKEGAEPPRDVPQSCQQHLSYACPVYQAVLSGRDIG